MKKNGDEAENEVNLEERKCKSGGSSRWLEQYDKKHSE